MTEAARENASRRQRRLFAWAYFILVVGTIGWHKLPWFKAETIYVSPKGSLWNSGTSKTAPLRSINDAISRVATSGHIYLLPGEYQERVHVRTGGTAEKPLIIEAVDPANTKLTWSRTIPDDLVLDWQPVEGGIFRAKVDWPIYQIRHDGSWLFRVLSGPGQFETLVQKRHAQSAFHYSNGALLVYLQDGQQLKDTKLEVNAPVPEPREWGEFRSSNIWLEADHVELRGLQCEFGIGSGVTLWNASHATIVDCSFTGANVGVNASHGVNFNHDLRVLRCLYHNYPQSNWRKVFPNDDGTIEHPQEQRWLDWKGVYTNYAASSLLVALNGNTLVENCLVAHAGDGMKVTNTAPNAKVIARNNLLMECTDDAFELDGPGVNVTLSKNVVINSHQNLGISPVTEGPCVIKKNTFIHNDFYLNGTQIKFLGNKPDQVIRNVLITDNVFFGDWLRYKKHNPTENVVLQRNSFVTRRSKEPKWPSGIVDDDNRYTDLVDDDIHQYEPVEVIDQLRSLGLDETADEISRVAVNAIHKNQFGPKWLDWTQQPWREDLGQWQEVSN